MMFIVRSVFWLSLVFSQMPFDSDEALRAVDDYDHQEMYQLTEAARQAGAKAKRIEEHKHARAHVEEPAVEAVK